MLEIFLFIITRMRTERDRGIDPLDLPPSFFSGALHEPFRYARDDD
jgi:hypothetical protein